MYGKLVSHKLSSFCKKCFLPAAQFSHKVWAALQTISHHLQKSLDKGIESYIVQLDFSAAFDRVNHSGFLFKLKSIGVAICTHTM